MGLDLTNGSFRTLWNHFPARQRFLAYWVVITFLLSILYSLFPVKFFIVLGLFHAAYFFPVYLYLKIKDRKITITLEMSMELKEKSRLSR